MDSNLFSVVIAGGLGYMRYHRKRVSRQYTRDNEQPRVETRVAVIDFPAKHHFSVWLSSLAILLTGLTLFWATA